MPMTTAELRLELEELVAAVLDDETSRMTDVSLLDEGSRP